MGSSLGRKIVLLAGSTYIFIIGSLLVLISLILVIILLNYQATESETSKERVDRKPPALITFADPATPLTEAVVTSDKTAQLVDSSSEADAAPIETATGITQIDAVTQPIPSSTLAPISNPTTTFLTPTPTATVGVTASPSGTPTSTPTPTLSPTPTRTPTTIPASPSPTTVPGSITGRLLFNGTLEGGITVKLEDQSQNTIAQTVTASDGTYRFPNLVPSEGGYNLVFAQEWNTQYPLDEVISWGWLGPISVADGNIAQMPDFDISLLGFEPTTPVPNASISAASVSSSTPILFEWADYPGAVRYWVDLAHGQDQTVIWQSAAQSTSLSFDGILDSGSQIQPGEYWWGVGARRDLGAYSLTVYGYLPVLLVVP